MDLNYLAMNILHPLLVYGLAGSTMMLLLVWLMIKFFKIQSAKLKAKLMLLPVIIPFGAYFTETLFYKKCLTALDHSQHFLASFNDLVCRLSSVAAGFFGPIFGALAAIIILKITISWVACNRIINRYGFAKLAQYPDLEAILEELCQKAGVKSPQVVITNHNYAKSFTFGHKKPVIVLSQAILENLQGEELEAILAHELAHIIRKDSFLSLIGSFFRDLLFFAPPVYLAFNHFEQEKEKAADDLALQLTGNPLALAGALIKVWRLTPKTMVYRLSFQANFLLRSSDLESRIRRLIDGNSGQGPQAGMYRLALLAGMLVILSLALVC